MKKIAQKLALSLLACSTFEQSGWALDSGTQNLTTTVGATDYFKINCAGDTDHLNFKLLENATTADPVETPDKPSVTIGTVNPTTGPILPQILNAKLSKLKLTTSASKIAAGTIKEISLSGGNGSYLLNLDTIGTNLNLKNSQIYSVQYQCLNTVNKVTTGSAIVTGSLSNGSTKSYTIKCSKSKTTGDTSSLKIKITNKTAITKIKSAAQVIETPASGNLMAQVLKGVTALNTIGEVLNLQGGNGDYSVMVNSPVNAAKNYRFQYSCLNTSNIETKTSLIQILQDQ
ncbi:MAG: hypothetical protein PHN45_05515 [Methylococcales bacterium]|nr:hypothetical protein [Methylococcales bacterium]MDD5754194.1 hypothetical protein [Methylococcales bacterium]